MLDASIPSDPNQTPNKTHCGNKPVPTKTQSPVCNGSALLRAPRSLAVFSATELPKEEGSTPIPFLQDQELDFSPCFQEFRTKNCKALGVKTLTSNWTTESRRNPRGKGSWEDAGVKTRRKTHHRAEQEGQNTQRRSTKISIYSTALCCVLPRNSAGCGPAVHKHSVQKTQQLPLRDAAPPAPAWPWDGRGGTDVTECRTQELLQPQSHSWSQSWSQSPSQPSKDREEGMRWILEEGNLLKGIPGPLER